MEKVCMTTSESDSNDFKDSQQAQESSARRKQAYSKRAMVPRQTRPDDDGDDGDSSQKRKKNEPSFSLFSVAAAASDQFVQFSCA